MSPNVRDGRRRPPATQDSVFQTDPRVHLTITDQIERAATRRPGLWPGRRALRPSRVGGQRCHYRSDKPAGRPAMTRAGRPVASQVNPPIRCPARRGAPPVPRPMVCHAAAAAEIPGVCSPSTSCPGAGRPCSNCDGGLGDIRRSAVRAAESYRVPSRPTQIRRDFACNARRPPVCERGRPHGSPESPSRTMALYCTRWVEKPKPYGNATLAGAKPAAPTEEGV